MGRGNLRMGMRSPLRRIIMRSSGRMSGVRIRSWIMRISGIASVGMGGLRRRIDTRRARRKTIRVHGTATHPTGQLFFQSCDGEGLCIGGGGGFLGGNDPYSNGGYAGLDPCASIFYGLYGGAVNCVAPIIPVFYAPPSKPQPPPCNAQPVV